MKASIRDECTRKADGFLRRHHMHPEDIDFEACVRESAADMKSGLEGRKVSYEMLPCYIGLKPFNIADAKAVLVLDAGGTNLRLATAVCQDGEIKLQLCEQQKIPGVEHEVSIAELFDTIADRCVPYLPEVKRIGFCFSYAMEMQENGDGKICFICKSIKLKDAPGKLVAQELKNALMRRDQKEMGIAVVNDSVAVALAARATKARYGGYIGLIIGTGFNICYSEYVSEIRTIRNRSYEAPDMLINMESDRFNKMTRGTFDHLYEQYTGDNDHPTMKMLTGAYLGGLCHLCFKGAAEEGLVSEETGEALQAMKGIGTEQLCYFLDECDDSAIAKCCASEEDAHVLRAIAELLIERAAKLVAALLVPVLRRSYRYEKNLPVCICAEGSTIQKVKGLKEMICRYLSENTGREEAFEMVIIDHATIRGTAIAALQNEAKVV